MPQTPCSAALASCKVKCSQNELDQAQLDRQTSSQNITLKTEISTATFEMSTERASYVIPLDPIARLGWQYQAGTIGKIYTV